jgi:hypothetical protein
MAMGSILSREILQARSKAEKRIIAAIGMLSSELLGINRGQFESLLPKTRWW